MNKNFKFILIAALAACGEQVEPTPTSSPQHRDTSAVFPETMDEETGNYEEFSHSIFLPSKFKKNQIIEGRYYVYDPDGISVYSEFDTTLAEAGTVITPINQFDSDLMDNQRGSFGKAWEIVTASGTGKVSSAALLQLPYPSKKYTTLESYALNHLHLTDSVHKSGRRHKHDPNGGYESEYNETRYTFEQGISLTISEGYEATSEILNIPNLSTQDGVYFLNALGFIDLFAAFDGKMPASISKSVVFIQDDESKEAIMEYDQKGALKSIQISPAEYGCGCWQDLRQENNSLRIETGCGC
jgi:hypothetical protein